MNMADAKLLATLRGQWMSDEPMSRHVSWRAGGAARRAYRPADLDDLVAVLRGLETNEPVLFVGLGSNLLIRDAGFRGTVIFTHGVFNAIALLGGNEIHAGAGVAAPKLARFAAMHELIGAEFFAGIPGTVGGALAMNAGCYGGETWRVVLSVTTIGRDAMLRERSAHDFELGYRHVTPRPEPGRGEEWFIAAHFRFPSGDGQAARATIKDLLARRIASQPLNQPNAGSVFRNPPGDHAARLIEACGLKGRRIGGAMISPKHANFIINTGGASAADIERMIELAHREVAVRFGVDLVREVRICGELA
jgi:UDP-N-acetylmuramate dehydrogenase